MIISVELFHNEYNKKTKYDFCFDLEIILFSYSADQKNIIYHHIMYKYNIILYINITFIH